jgi:hypothetical protein
METFYGIMISEHQNNGHEAAMRHFINRLMAE